MSSWDLVEHGYGGKLADSMFTRPLIKWVETRITRLSRDDATFKDGDWQVRGITGILQ